MSRSLETDLILDLICSKLAERALSGVSEIENILLERGSELQETSLQNIKSLLAKLQQANKDVAQFQDLLRNASSTISPGLRAVMSAQLPECDTVTAIMIKQLMRLGRDTPWEKVNLGALRQYESFLGLTIEFLSFATQLLSTSSIEDQDTKLRNEDAKSLLTKLICVYQDVKKSKGILLDATTNINTPSPSSSQQDMLDPLPPAYEAPPPFDESVGSDYINRNVAIASGSGSASASGKDKQYDGFLSSLINPFKAATAALRPKPEPFVVPLCQAATVCNVPQMRFLLNNGANINGRNENGQTALICAVLAHQLDAIRFLLEAGADRGTRNAGRGGKPPLFHAVDVEDRAAVDLLFEHGANVNQKDDSSQPYFVNLITGETPPEWIALLLQHGADAGTQDLYGRRVVVLALQNRKSVEDREQVVELLLRHGADPNVSDLSGSSLLFLCAQQGRHALVHRLLGLGADPNSRGVSGTPVLAMAVERNDRDLAETLLGVGADPNTRDISGTCVLTTAIKRNDRALVKMLLGHGADPNQADIYGTPAVLSVLCDRTIGPADREDLLAMLFAHGAQANKKDMYGVTALEHALAAPTTTTTSSPSSPSPSSAPNADADAATAAAAALKIPELLLKHGADPNQRLTKAAGEPTLLTHALRGGQWDLVRAALACGADANLADKSGRTPLLLAVLGGSEDAVALLLRHGADVNQMGLVSPLEVATAGITPGMARLLKAKANG
ncbi:ankyrin repeat-containing domain protein [Xylariaceae sp. FL1651]|nr:ankyrin repeat-containing domain protein [Xylariaceae sp. FL1651]